MNSNPIADASKQPVPDASTDTGTGRIDQLTVKCLGRIELPEDNPVYGTYSRSWSVDLGVCTNLREAAILAERRVTEPYQHLVHVPEARGFSPHLISIRDASNRLASGGEVGVGRRIEWFTPVGSDEEARDVEKAAADLREQSGFETGWDNFSTGDHLYLRAQKLEARLVDPIWRTEAASIPRTSAERRLERLADEYQGTTVQSIVAKYVESLQGIIDFRSIKIIFHTEGDFRPPPAEVLGRTIEVFADIINGLRKASSSKLEEASGKFRWDLDSNWFENIHSVSTELRAPRRESRR